MRVVVVDDQELVRTGFALILGSDPRLEVVAQSADGAQAVAAATHHHPNVMLMDIRMPGARDRAQLVMLAHRSGLSS